MKITVGAINISDRTGTVKKPVPAADFDLNGIIGDAHAGEWHRQISLLGTPSIRRFESRMSRTIGPGEFGENITIDGMDLNDVSILDRFRIGDVEMEITQIGKTCHGDDCAIFREVGKCVMPKEGLFARVITPGRVEAGQEMSYIPRPFKVRVLTVSDRAYAGRYADLSGPRVTELVGEHYGPTRWHVNTDYEVIPDEAAIISEAVRNAVEVGTDIIFTTGGTGIGPRDLTVDVITELADKTVPGVMEHIRLKYGGKNPNALISRSVCAIIGSTLVYTLPGSVKAVQEYLQEIFGTVDHMVTMLHGIGH
ncbi:MAG: molybdenum cofactor synthesis domain-containing protein [Spirochaetota bacterium]|nr:molybdenum cofactor synthesis domain-containing protein [Spirochaetota bacterium]